MGGQCTKLLQFFSYIGSAIRNLVSRKGKPETIPEIQRENENDCQINDYQINDIIYSNCTPEMEIERKTIESIIDYAFNKMHLTLGSDNAEESYAKYCKSLYNKLGNGEPFGISMGIEGQERIFIISKMKEVLPNDVSNEPLIEKATTNLLDNFYGHSANRFVSSQFVAIRVSQSGDNLEIIPSLMSVRKAWFRERSFWFLFDKWIYRHVIEYRQMKYILTKIDIEDICNDIDNQKNISDSDSNTPLTLESHTNFGSTEFTR